MTGTEHALRGPFYLLERRHGLAHPSAEILDRPVDVLVERLNDRGDSHGGARARAFANEGNYADR